MLSAHLFSLASFVLTVDASSKLTFSPSIALEKITPTGPEANAVLAEYGYAMNRTLVNEDEPAHMPRRRLLMEPFTPQALRHHEPLVRRVTREYVDRFVDSGRADLVVMQTLKTLVAQTGESASFHVLKQQGPSFVRLCQFRVDSPHSLRDHVKAGDILPSSRGVGARVLIAFVDHDLAKGATSKEKALYKNIREDGYVALIGDRDPDLAGISAPVFSAAGSLVGAVTLTIPTHRYKTDHIHWVIEAARDLCARI